MKALLISFVVGLLVGVIYGVIRVKKPRPAYHCAGRLAGNGARRTVGRLDPYKKDQRDACCFSLSRG